MGSPREITQRELRNESGEVMHALDRGATFIVTRNGVPVATLQPLRRNTFTKGSEVIDAFRCAPAIDARAFRAADVLIAATAMANALPLYTRYPEDFSGFHELLEIVEV